MHYQPLTYFIFEVLILIKINFKYNIGGFKVDIFSRSVIELIISFVIFFVLTFIGIFIVGKLKNSNNRFLNPKEFLPEDELHSLRQVYYLILMACC